MRLTWPALKATCEPHTVTVGDRLVGGYLVRCTSSRRTLGWVWRIRDFLWGWRTNDAEHFGERSDQRAAVEVLRDIQTVIDGGQLTLPHLERPVAPPRRVPPPPPRRVEVKTVSLPPTPKPVVQIKWADAPDLTSAVADALRRGGKR